jgi:putative methionine-R-sulfoxide reductase with GAF domain
VTDKKNKPVLDEQTFGKLLEAAFVLQEHNRQMRELEESLETKSEQLREQERAIRASQPSGKIESENVARGSVDYTVILAEIVEAQHQIQMRRLELDKAMAVVAERVARITGASGAAIGVIEGKNVRYSAGAGASALPAGTEVPLDQAICQASLRTGQVVRTEDVNGEFLFDPETCRKRGILSLLAVPIYRDGEIAGALELYFDRIRGFAEQDIHTCQLMAGLITEAMARDAESKLKTSMVAERSTMLAAIESLKPDLAALAQKPSAPSVDRSAASNSAGTAKHACWKCSNELLEEEQFCGNCGAARAAGVAAPSMQSKLAAAWHTQQTGLNANFASPELADAYSAPPFTVGELDDIAMAEFPSLELESEDNNVESPAPALVKTQQRQTEDLVWSSAAKAQTFLESLSAARTPGALARFWRSRRGDFYLVTAVILVVAVMGWGIWSNKSVGAADGGTSISRSANRRRPAPDADLSTFDKVLIGLGLADSPEPPAYRGNPDTQVWIDLQTALYYCPGADVYGKTPKGKLSSQRDAQLDQFEPAARKACD